MTNCLQPTTVTVTVVKGIPTATSIDIAQHFGKRHERVLDAIRSLLTELPESARHNFVLSDYRDVTGRTLPSYLLTRDGFTLLAMGFTGKRALAFKLAYIDAFNRMEAQLSRPALPQTISPAQQQTLKAMINVASSATQTSHQELWSRFHDHFKVARYDQLPAARYDDAVEYIRDGVTQDSDAMSRLAAAAFLRGRQFLLTVDHRGQASMRKLECWEAVVGCDEVPSLIASGWVPRAAVAEVAAAAVQRLSRPTCSL